ncbi:MAG TPA: PIN domain-containing protein [Nitrospirae bacterium]|nr:tRNA(fMet)-specific endonuclease VapC [bacterium BMS3Abin06]HDH06322.1 PIN domain-containing protein [Nitrospirota bacterium]HDH10645.1 PIN domain-containing protein [Nitrospirota bacterium]HDZ02342.1 PIN domain-containing protein [Nitrospirota bacterium]
MKKYFVDTNVFMRYLLNDVPEHADRVEKILDKAEKGKIRLVTGPPVFFELAWTLKSFYEMKKNEIYKCLLSIAGIPGLEVTDIDVITESLEVYKEHPVEFSDAYISVLSKKLNTDGVITFNKKHFDKLDVTLYSI